MYKINQHPHHFKTDIPTLIIIGPTASGKTDFSFALAQELSAEIINSDMGQFYQPFSIGTAKPDWKNESTPCHLFDLLDKPQDLGVVPYRNLVFEKIHEITKNGKTPIIVGGSHFYVKSLFYPPVSYDSDKETLKQQGDLEYNWEKLNHIDPVRAQQIHPHDTYRIKRGLDLWHITGEKPSSLAPTFIQEFPVIFVVINPDDATLKQRIEQRTINMLNKQDGWLQEVERLLGTEWEPFMSSHKLIGYDHIVTFLKENDMSKRSELIKIIQHETWHYAKKQKKFIKRLMTLIMQEHDQGHFIGKVITVADIGKEQLQKVLKHIISG